MTSAIKRLTILVVDDDEGVTSSYAHMLTLDGYRVRTAVSGKAGLVEAESCRPDVILLDLFMPIVDGVAFLRQLRSLEHLQHTPVAIITGVYWFDDSVSAELKALGAKVYFKPICLDGTHRNQAPKLAATARLFAAGKLPAVSRDHGTPWGPSAGSPAGSGESSDSRWKREEGEGGATPSRRRG